MQLLTPNLLIIKTLYAAALAYSVNSLLNALLIWILTPLFFLF